MQKSGNIRQIKIIDIINAFLIYFFSKDIQFQIYTQILQSKLTY